MIVIFSGYNQRAVISFLRTLTINSINEYLIVASSPQDTILQTDYAPKVGYVREKKELEKQEIFSILRNIIQYSHNSINLIAPSTEALNRFLLNNRNELEEMGYVIPLVDIDLYEKISDKESFYHICKSNGLCVPAEISIGDSFLNSFVAKPKRYILSNGKNYSPILVKNELDFTNFMATCPIEDFSFQEYVDGESFYLLFYFSKWGGILYFAKKYFTTTQWKIYTVSKIW